MSFPTNANATNNFGVAQLIVDSVAGKGTHTTIANALTTAVSGQTIFIRPGTYTENLTLKVGVNLTAFVCDAVTPNVTISGTCTLSTAGTVTISGIRLQTNSAAAIAVTGSVASILQLRDCYLNCTNATGITFSSSSASASITMKNCDGDVGTTGIAIFAHSSAGYMLLDHVQFGNSGGSSTANTASAGIFNMMYYNFANPITTSGTNQGTWEHGLIDSLAQNVISATIGSGTTVSAKWGRFTGGSASAISIAGSMSLEFCTISSSNNNSITGAGTLAYGNLSFVGSLSIINVTTQVPLISRYGISASAFQPCFLAHLGSNVTSVTGDGTAYTLICDIETFDNDSNYNNTTGIFTAPIAGRYLFTSSVYFLASGTSTFFSVAITGTSTSLNYNYNHNAVTDTNQSGYSCSGIIDMAVGDTCKIIAIGAGGTKNNTISNTAAFGTGNATFFSGHLVC